MYLTDFMFTLIGVLTSVAFFTLMERKIMGLMHYRKGPNKTVLAGLSQPLADALKLLTKETQKMSSYKMFMYMLGPVTMMTVMTACWVFYESGFNGGLTGSTKILMILTTMSTSAYGLILTSWGSNSKYALLGGNRAIAQTISYEVCLALFVISIVLMFKTMNMGEIKSMQSQAWTAVTMAPLFLGWVLLCLAESNRTPFDLAEGESEIVSGFNIEYGGGGFALIFISEYGMMMFLSFFTSLMFLGGGAMLAKMMVISTLMVWVRPSLPRVRYDMLMMTSWKILTPYSVAAILMSTTIM